MKMNVYQEISQIIKEADGILIGASNGLSIAEGYNIFADDAWFQKNMGDFREKYGLYCVLQGFSVPMKVEEKWAFVSRLVKAKAMQDEPSEIMKNIYALVKDKEYFVVTSNAEDHLCRQVLRGRPCFLKWKLTQMRCRTDVMTRSIQSKSSSRHDRRGSKRKSTQRVTAEMSKMRWRYGSKLG